MYVLARNIADQGRTIPEGTPLSDVYEIHDRSFVAMAHVWGIRIRLRLTKFDFKIKTN